VRRLINLGRTHATKRSRPRTFLHRHFIPWRLDRTLRRVGFKKLDATFCTYGLFAAMRLSPFFLSLSRLLAPYSRTPAGVLGSNYIVKVQKPFRNQWPICDPLTRPPLAGWSTDPQWRISFDLQTGHT
jgi:hypothetical protein